MHYALLKPMGDLPFSGDIVWVERDGSTWKSGGLVEEEQENWGWCITQTKIFYLSKIKWNEIKYNSTKQGVRLCSIMNKGP